MTNEEFDRRAEFIVEQQAQFATDIQQLREAQAQTDQLVNRLAAVTLEGFKDVNAKIDALVDSQMRLADAQAVLSEDFRGTSAKIDALVDSQVRLADVQAALSENFKDASAKIDALADSHLRLTDSHARLAEAQERLTEAQERLADSQALTDEKLRNLIAVVDRYFSEGRNGKANE